MGAAALALGLMPPAVGTADASGASEALYTVATWQELQDALDDVDGKVEADGPLSIRIASDSTISTAEHGQLVYTGDADLQLDGDDSVVLTGEGQRRILHAAGSEASTITVTGDMRWQHGSARRPAAFGGHRDEPRPVRALALSADGSTLVSTWHHDDVVRAIDLDTGKVQWQLPIEASINAVAIAPDAARVYTAERHLGAADATVRAIDAATGEEEWAFTGHDGAVSAVAVTPDGQTVISGSHDTTVRGIDAESSQQQWTYAGHGTNVNDVAVSPDGETVVSGGSDGTVHAVDADTGNRQWANDDRDADVRSVAVSPDDDVVVAGRANGEINAIDGTTGAPRQVEGDDWAFTGHDASVSAVTVTPDGASVLSASFDGTVRSVDLHSGGEQWTFARPFASFSDVVAAPDGVTALVARGHDGIDMVEAATGASRYGPGGAIRATSAVVVAGAATFEGNTADEGGAITGTEVTVLDDATFVDNAALRGGAVVAVEGDIQLKVLGARRPPAEGAGPRVRVAGPASFEGNEAEQGGAIHAGRGSVTLAGEATLAGTPVVGIEDFTDPTGGREPGDAASDTVEPAPTVLALSLTAPSALEVGQASDEVMVRLDRPPRASLPEDAMVDVTIARAGITRDQVTLEQRTVDEHGDAAWTAVALEPGEDAVTGELAPGAGDDHDEVEDRLRVAFLEAGDHTVAASLRAGADGLTFAEDAMQVAVGEDEAEDETPSRPPSTGDPEPEPEPEPDPDPEPAPDPDPEPAPDPEPDPAPEPDPDPEPDRAPPARVDPPGDDVAPIEPALPEGGWETLRSATGGAVVDGEAHQAAVSRPEDSSDQASATAFLEAFTEATVAGRRVALDDQRARPWMSGLLSDPEDEGASRSVPASAVTAVAAGDIGAMVTTTTRPGAPREGGEGDRVLASTAGATGLVAGGLPSELDGQVQLHSDARVLGEFVTDAAGTLAGEFAIPEDLPLGPHTLVLTSGDTTLGLRVQVDDRRLGGADRFATAAALSQAAVADADTDAVERVLLAASHDPSGAAASPDALGAAALAGQEALPVLLVDGHDDALDAATAEELDRLDPDAVTVLGGPAVIADEVLAAVEDAGDWRVERLAGADRYATAAQIASQVEAADDVMLVASGERLVDALSAGALAAAGPHPIVLAREDHLPAASAEALAQADRAILVGGERVLSEDVAAQVAEATGSEPLRLAGADRAGTAAALADHLIDEVEGFDGDGVVLANGDTLVDALTGAGYAGRLGHPIVLVRDDDDVPAATRGWLEDQAGTLEAQTTLGGDAVISEALVERALGLAHR